MALTVILVILGAAGLAAAIHYVQVAGKKALARKAQLEGLAVQDSVRTEPVSVALAQPAPPPPPPRRESPIIEMISRLREKNDAGVPCESALRSVIGEFSEDELEVIGLAAKAGYTPADVVEVMAKWHYSIEDADTLLSDEFKLDVASAARVLDKVFLEGTPEVRAKRLVGIFDDDDELEDLVPVLTEMLGSRTAVGELLYWQTDMGFSDVVAKLAMKKDVAAIAELANKIAIDLADSDEYLKLRDDDEGDCTFEEAAKILSATGKDAEGIVAAENDYEPFDMDEVGHRAAFFDALRPCGISDADILSAIDSIADDTKGKIVTAAMENDVSVESLLAFIRSNFGDDFDSIWTDLHDADVDTEDIIEIMHALIPSERRRFGKKPEAPKAAE